MNHMVAKIRLWFSLWPISWNTTIKCVKCKTSHFQENLLSSQCSQQVFKSILRQRLTAKTSPYLQWVTCENMTKRQLYVHVLWGALLQTIFVSSEPTQEKRSNGKLLKIREGLMCEWSRGGTGSPRFPQMFTDVVDVCRCPIIVPTEEEVGWSRVHHPPNQDPACYRKIPTSGWITRIIRIKTSSALRDIPFLKKAFLHLLYMVLENNFQEQMLTLNATLRDPQLLGFPFGVCLII